VSGRLAADGSLEIQDPGEASSIYAKGYFGTVQSGGGLSLDRFDSVYLCEMGRVDAADARGRSVPWVRVFRRAARGDPSFGIRYLVYRDLRQRGYVVRTSPPPVAFTVLPRGGVLNKTPSRFWVEALSERAPFDLRRLFELAERAQSAKKLLLLALVDEESDLTYYRVRRTHPHGALPARPLVKPTEGILAHDRVLLFDPEAVEELGRALAYGSRVGHRLELSLIEGSYLLGTGQLELQDGSNGRALPVEQFERRVLRLDPDFTERKAAYRDLRGRGLVVKTGFKYGAHFRAYPRSPDHSHARYLIHAVPDAHIATWPAVAGAIRVAQGVRKEFLLAGVRPDGTVRYLSLERIRP
jgi:tRNA-intron endonuclease